MTSPADSGQWGRLTSIAQETAQRESAVTDPGLYHGDIAAAELHWFDAENGQWLRRNPATGDWSGYDAATGAAVPAGARPADWRPWSVALDDSAAPFYRWYAGAHTNACFNELDRHVLGGRGARAAFIFEGDRWDPSKNAGQGGPVFELTVSYRRLLLETVLRAEVLSSLGLKKGDRVAFNLPNIPEQLFYTEAAKRLGIIYTPVFGGFSAKTLSDRIADAGARVVVTADGGYRNAEVVPFKGIYTDPALDNYLPRPVALAALERVLGSFAIGATAKTLGASVAEALAGEITVERSDIMRELGRALSDLADLSPEQSAEIRTTVARELAAAEHIVEHVVVVRYTGQDIVEQPRDQWSHDLVAAAAERVLSKARAAGFAVDSLDALTALDDQSFWQALHASHPVVPVEADWPLFIIYTSGSTGKPKGVVHTHGGWLAGIAHTMRMVFGVDDDDRLYVIADPGWITGQSYLIAAPLAQGITSIVAEGSPLFPSAGRFSSIIQRQGATLFKAGSTFLKAVMTDPSSRQDMAAYDMSQLKAGTFCAEPVSPAVQQFAMDNVCGHYINSYWATEHGGIVFSCPWGGFKPLAADAKTWPLPWIQAEVRVPVEQDESGHAVQWRRAEQGEKGELVITQPYPYLARTIWGDAERLGSSEWRGDLQRFSEVYFNRWSGGLAYTQGDYARQHDDGAFTLHGRSDDVINVSGHRIGTEEIEGAILRDKTLRADSPLGNAVVVGAPHDEKGETPVAFVIAAPGSRLTDDDLARLQNLVRSEKGSTAVPSDFLVVSAFPETRSGKYMRRTLRAILLGDPLGDLSTLRNPEVVDEISATVAEWKAFGKLSQARQIVQTYRYLRIENHEIAPGQFVALVVINHPPVNSLNERSLDELNTVLQHVVNKPQTVAVVITGAGSAFVAGADVKELLEVGEAGDLASAQTPPNAAHTAFSLLENLPKPVIAAVNGPALGGGNELVLACGYVIADHQARFGQPEINLNLLPGYGGTQRLPRRLHAKAGDKGLTESLRLILSGRSVDAEAARDVGLVDEIVGLTGAGPVAVAMDRIRRYLNNEGPLVAAMQEREAYLATREAPLPYNETLLQQSPVAQALAQLEHSGRAVPVQRILQALAHGAEQGQSAGLKLEAELFAAAVCDPDSGPKGIREFLEKRSAPLPVRYTDVPPDADAAQRQQLEAAGRLLPLDASFYPGVTPVPEYQYGMGVIKDAQTGLPLHADPKDAERLLVFKTPEPGPNEALIYMLASEVNFNDIWALTGIPVSPFDNRDADTQVTGSGGVALIAQLGHELVREGRLSVGQLVTVYSGQSELLSPDQGLDPMAANFHIQGYEINDGSHAQFLVVQGPQLQPKLAGLTIEEAGSYALTFGTIHRALFRTLDVQPGRRLFVEGASTGTGLECLRSARQSGLDVVGMVSSAERAARVTTFGGKPVNRKDPRWADIFTPVPDDPAEWDAWEAAGKPFVEEAHALAGGPVDYVVSHAGERAFGRSFQLLGEGGVLTFFGASSGYRFSFMGKPGAEKSSTMLARAGLRSGRTLLVIYGPGAEDGIVDPVAIEAIEVGCSLNARVAVLVDTVSQREFVTSLGFGAQFAGVVSIEEIRRRLGDDFDPPGPLAPMPDPFTESAAFKESVRGFSDRTLKPIGSAIAPLLRSSLDKRGLPDVVFERRDRDGLPLATSLVKPNVGTVVYAEDLGGRRFSFYAPQVWMRQRRILMPNAEIRGTHLNTAREFAEVQERIAAGMIDVVEPVPVALTELPEAHQAMWENRHAGATYVAVHALPRLGLKTKDELYRAWAIRDAEARGEQIVGVDTGSAGTLR
ncbi:MAG: AMP-binding protein [Gammaproteobacteria bacterium]|jgi:acrylyl-CoA reductase (NADPH)/3-hydroxypropionyl-CoA dehydratase/3-hydroxypropionyl-CoA synthetase|nr:AMP-binding protein [Gammaproteobacteria bacterium]